jgi:hypothetical protein
MKIPLVIFSFLVTFCTGRKDGDQFLGHWEKRTPDPRESTFSLHVERVDGTLVTHFTRPDFRKRGQTETVSNPAEVQGGLLVVNGTIGSLMRPSLTLSKDGKILSFAGMEFQKVEATN